MTLTLTGAPASGTMSLTGLKYLIGNPTPNPLTVPQLLNNLVWGVANPEVAGVWRYNGTGFTLLTQQSDTVAPGQAVFILMNASRTWTLPGATSTTSTFVYDGDGGRVKQLTSAGTTVYVGPLYELRNGQPVKHILRGTDLVASVEGGKVLFHHEDHLGSTNIVTEPSGANVELLEYTPYGSVARKEGTVAFPHTFTGHRQDATGLVFMGARYYDPSLGRFVTADPTIQRMGDPQDLNRYSYARNNPLKYTDPSGHGWFKKLGKALLAAAIAVATLFIASIPGGQPAAAVFAKTAFAAAGATLTLDTGEGRQFQAHLAKEVFDDAFGMRPRAAAFTAGMVSHTVVSSAFYVGLTTAFPEPSPGTDFSKPENQGKIFDYKTKGHHQPGGSTANFIRSHEGRANVLPQGVIASDIAFNDTPIVGPLFRAIDARHAAFTTQIGGKFFDSAEVVLMSPLKGRIYGSPWTGISHQALFNTMVAGGITGFGAVAQATSQVGWSFYLSSSLYGVNSAYGVSGMYSGLVNVERRQ